jgi:glycolate oxidase
MLHTIGRELGSIVGPEAVLSAPEDLMLYEYDGSVERARPQAVVFPSSTEQVAALVRWAGARGLPVVARGAGTGLSGGAIAVEGGLMIGFSRMNKILEIDIENQRAVAQPGVVNLDLSTPPLRAAITSPPIPPAKRRARWAATWPKMPAGRIRWPTA